MVLSPAWVTARTPENYHGVAQLRRPLNRGLNRVCRTRAQRMLVACFLVQHLIWCLCVGLEVQPHNSLAQKKSAQIGIL